MRASLQAPDQLIGPHLRLICHFKYMKGSLLTAYRPNGVMTLFHRQNHTGFRHDAEEFHPYQTFLRF